MSGNINNLFGAFRAENSTADAPTAVPQMSPGCTVQYEADDPDPLAPDASTSERLEYKRTVETYCEEMLEALRDSDFSGEELWIEYTATFRAHTIVAMSKKLVQRWVTFLLSRGVHVTRRRSFPRALALIDCLYQETFVSSSADANAESDRHTSETDLTMSKYAMFRGNAAGVATGPVCGGLAGTVGILGADLKSKVEAPTRNIGEPAYAYLDTACANATVIDTQNILPAKECRTVSALQEDDTERPQVLLREEDFAVNGTTVWQVEVSYPHSFYSFFSPQRSAAYSFRLLKALLNAYRDDCSAYCIRRIADAFILACIITSHCLWHFQMGNASLASPKDLGSKIRRDIFERGKTVNVNLHNL